MSLKENRYGDIKGHTCSYVRIQWKTIKKEGADSPIVAIESVFVAASVDIYEGQDVATF